MITEARVKYWNSMKGKSLSSITKNKMSLKAKGHIVSSETREKIREKAIGRLHTQETKDKLSELKIGEKHPNWKGGISSLNQRLRASREYKEWRLMVFGRDNFTCQDCKKRGIYLEAHHIKSFSLFPEFRFDISNGITLCIDCHGKTDLYRKRSRRI